MSITSILLGSGTLSKATQADSTFGCCRDTVEVENRFVVEQTTEEIIIDDSEVAPPRGEDIFNQ